MGRYLIPQACLDPQVVVFDAPAGDEPGDDPKQRQHAGETELKERIRSPPLGRFRACQLSPFIQKATKLKTSE